MSLPLTLGQNINFNREIRDPYYEMRIPDKYNDFYALSYIISGKLDNARRLLVETYLMIKEISENCGF